MDLVARVYQLTSAFPESERFGLTNQLRRAAVSIPSNIAEGQGRLTPGEFRQFLGIARGSFYETDTQIRISTELEMADKESAANAHRHIESIAKQLNALITSTRKTTNH